MFSSTRVIHPGGFIEYRTETLTGFRTRICPERLKRGIGNSCVPEYSSDGCPFCPGLVESVTPVFSDGTRIRVGESITFPNLYPFAAYHIVTVITGAHSTVQFTPSQVADALSGQLIALKNQDGYISINWNYLPSAGASIPHPHLQGLVDNTPDTLPAQYINSSSRYYKQYGTPYFSIVKLHEEQSKRSLAGTRLFWYAHPVPCGEREIRCILPITTVSEFSEYIDDFCADLVEILGLYRDLGTSAFNMSIFFGTEKESDYFTAFCSIIARINPNPLSTSDTAFMERLHLEPVILTLPEDLACGRHFC